MYKLHLMRIDLPISFEIYIHSDTSKTLYTFTEEILNEKFHFLCSVMKSILRGVVIKFRTFNPNADITLYCFLV